VTSFHVKVKNTQRVEFQTIRLLDKKKKFKNTQTPNVA
jgi:hypothetical protein